MAALLAGSAASLEEYLDGIELALEFREYVDGCIRFLPPTSLEHGLLAGRLALSLDPRPRRDRPSCRVLLRGMLIRTDAGNVFSPDAMAYCGKPRLERRGDIDFLLNPALLVEVVSPGGGAYETGEKWQHYQSIATLREYLIVYEAEPRVLRYSRTDAEEWRIDEFAGARSAIRLETLRVELNLHDLYEGVLTADEASA